MLAVVPVQCRDIASLALKAEQLPVAVKTMPENIIQKEFVIVDVLPVPATMHAVILDRIVYTQAVVFQIMDVIQMTSSVMRGIGMMLIVVQPSARHA